MSRFTAVLFIISFILLGIGLLYIASAVALDSWRHGLFGLFLIMAGYFNLPGARE